MELRKLLEEFLLPTREKKRETITNYCNYDHFKWIFREEHEDVIDSNELFEEGGDIWREGEEIRKPLRSQRADIKDLFPLDYRA